MRYIYVIQQIDIIEDQPIGGVVIGAFTNLKKARQSLKELKAKERSVRVLYDLITVPANQIPTTTDEYEQAIYELIDKGLMEALVGEDGYFYYELTEEGKIRAKNMIKKMENLDDEDDEDGELR
tara:strand:- start:75 stop:446 length:372 start_codon:yes stop_codon:yes gene_type:complete